MFSVQIASDLHIEIIEENIKIDPLSYITPKADILILAGDIGSFYKFDQLYNFINDLSKYFKYILYVPGNHEYYMINNYEPLDIKILENRKLLLGQKINNLIVLDKNSVLIDNVCIIGCTLWSKPECKVPNFLVRIKGINTYIYENNHKNDLDYIHQMIEYCKNKKLKLIVITHYPPSYKILKDSKKIDKFVSLYVNKLDHLLENKKIHTWICGHIHSNFNFMSKEGTRVVSNQLGKPKDKITDYKKCFNIKIF